MMDPQEIIKALVSVYPFDAFTFDEPSKHTIPCINLTDPWVFNSIFYAPVVAEPCIGLPYPHFKELLSVDPASTAVQELDISADLPSEGTTTWIDGWIGVTAPAVGHTLAITDAAGAKNYGIVTDTVANIQTFGNFSAPVIGGKIYWQVDDVAVSLVKITMVRYFWRPR